jgi:hypothetical protein
MKAIFSLLTLLTISCHFEYGDRKYLTDNISSKYISEITNAIQKENQGKYPIYKGDRFYHFFSNAIKMDSVYLYVGQKNIKEYIMSDADTTSINKKIKICIGNCDCVLVYESTDGKSFKITAAYSTDGNF